MIVNVPLNVDALRFMFVVEETAVSAETAELFRDTRTLSPARTADPCSGCPTRVNKICCWLAPKDTTPNLFVTGGAGKPSNEKEMQMSPRSFTSALEGLAAEQTKIP